MSTKTLITMTAIAVCLTVAAVLMDDGRDSRAAWERVQKPLYASLKEQGDQVAEILIQSASETTTLVREGEEWSVVERGGYPGRSDEVGRLLFALAEAELDEPMTRRPENYAKLGLGGFESEESPTVQLTAKDGAGEILADLLIGNRRTQGVGEGWYVREPENSQVWSVSAKLRTPKRTAEWLQTELLDIGRERINEVRIEPADSPEVQLLRQGPEGEAFDIQNLPEGREPKSPRTAGTFLSSLANLRISDVKPAAEEGAFPETPGWSTTWWTQGGLSLRGEFAEVDAELLCRLSASFDPSRAQAPEMGPTPDSELEDPEQEGEEQESRPTPEQLQAEASELNEKLSGWVFVLPSWKKASILTTMEELLSPAPEVPETQESESPVEPAPVPDDPAGDSDGQEPGADPGGDQK